MNYRIRKSSGKIYYNPAIKSIYYNRQTWSQLARQYYRYGRGKVKMLRQYPESLRPRQTVAPLFVVGLLSGLVLALISRPLRWIYVGVLFLYLLLGLIFAIRAVSKQSEDVSIWRTLLTFIIMHIAWGLGFWREVIKPGAF
ncbi:MAG: hypothetical protein Q9P01_18865 [Anaerolineae bacterium]|nr:hypothetical protein [Anaerolineae bacterium]